MHNIRIYAAPSLSVVIDQLSIYHFTGVLTIWRASDARQGVTRITIELGRPLHVYRGSYWENATESILAWINTWGEMHFSFQPTEARLQLPPPSPSTPAPSVLPQQRPLSTAGNIQPLQVLPVNNLATESFPAHTPGQQRETPSSAFGKAQELSLPYAPLRQDEQNNHSANGNSSPELVSEKAIASLTTFGRNYAPANLPRYDRTIFLLVNGRRTVSDLAQLIKRSPEEIYTTLHRLQNLQLITFETLAPQP
ncbi:MAG: hypothetical protein E6I91_16410 [Chloroflexi bacterium]|nr:MAG: hypothetical protein E6I91_16410 [Chloroflexota bacterium]